MSSIFPILIFLAIAFSYTWFFHYRIARQNLQLEDGPGRLLYVIGLPGPTIAAIITALLLRRFEVIIGSLTPITVALPRWALSAFIIPAIYYVAALIYSMRTGTKLQGIFKRPVMGWPALLFIQLYVVASEEIGWRGFALPVLNTWLGSVPGTVVLGFVWALWHLPMFSVSTSNQKGSFWRYSYTLVMWSFIMASVVAGNNGNIIPAMVFHASANIAFFTMNIPEEAEWIAELLLGAVAIGFAIFYL